MKNWQFVPEPNKESVQHLSEKINVNEVLCKILIQRGINEYDKARKYFRPSVEMLHNPFLMKDMDKAVNRLTDAISNEEKVLIYGDYDVDGTTAVSLVYGFLKQFTSNCEYYIPDRYKEGYGVSTQGIDYAHEQGISLIICLDCGVRAVEKVAYAKSLGIDFIICDHHLPGDKIPEAYAILDPKQNDCLYPYKELCGVGVGFKLIQAFCEQQDIPFEQLEEQLDLVAVGTAADIVPITGENRALVYYGMNRINSSPRTGIRALLKIAAKDQQRLTVTDVVFTLAPRINAAGRIGHGKDAVQLLLEDDYNQAETFAYAINKNNSNRKVLDSSITEQALEQIELKYADTKSTVLFNPDWHKGVIGIVASRCIETYYRPTVILTESNGKATGSVRSVKGFDVYQAIEKCSDLLEQFGGHAYAAGLTMDIANIDTFREKFESVINDTITQKELEQTILIDSEVNINQITHKFNNILKQMEPFGPGNMSPVFVSRNVRADSLRLLKDLHLKFKVTQDDDCFIDVIAFNMGEFYSSINANQRFDICYSIEENTFRGVTNLQLAVKDIRLVD